MDWMKELSDGSKVGFEGKPEEASGAWFVCEDHEGGELLRWWETKDSIALLLKGFGSIHGFHVEPVLKVLIEELKRKQAQEPCPESDVMIGLLTQALRMQTQRMARVKLAEAPEGRWCGKVRFRYRHQ